MGWFLPRLLSSWRRRLAELRMEAPGWFVSRSWLTPFPLWTLRLQELPRTFSPATSGKRVIVLKQLGTGLVLITGPHKLNGCPLRRVNQRYLVDTKTKLDVAAVKVPETINDKYFARVKADKAKKEGDIFEAKKEAYKPSEQRKADQAAVDAQVLAAIKAHKEGAVLKQYLGATFALSKGEFPHKMQF